MNALRKHLPGWFALDRDRRLTLLAFALALALHTSWWLGLPAVAMVRTGTEIEHGPYVEYLPAPVREASDAMRAMDVREFRSPTVFSLPTSVGFSRDSLAQPLVTPPPVALTSAPPVFRNRDENPAPRVMETHPEAVALRSPSSDAHPVQLLPTFARRDLDTNAVVQLIWLEELAASKPQTIAVAPGSVWDDEKPWEAVASVVVNPEGTLNHVFIEKPTASAKRNMEFARYLRAAHVEPSDGPRSGRVIARFNGRAARAPAGEEAAAP